MKHILLAGSGRSAAALIHYLLENALQEDWEITIADIHPGSSVHPRERRILFDVTDEFQCSRETQRADLVISLLPASFHSRMAVDCIRYKKHFLTASYVSEEIRALDTAAREGGVLLLNEMGLDPGIDHMSAMAMIDAIKTEGGKIHSFKSYTGGLIAPESVDNPWEYKFTWNPRNVVLAGQATAHYMGSNQLKYVPYHRLFKNPELIHVEGIGLFEGYPNRDSLQYIQAYGLENIETMLRGTFRMPGYCKAWDVFVQLGWTDDSFKIKKSDEKISYATMLNSFLPEGTGPLELRLSNFLGEDIDGPIMEKLKWLDIFNEEEILFTEASPAALLQLLLERKWALKATDKDRTVMQHQIEYTINGKKQKKTSSLTVTGSDAVNTAMAKTVGLPLGIAAKLILQNKIRVCGVHIPTIKEIYVPVLEELEKHEIAFIEKEEDVTD
jgi:saccharopine dehydrogenase-like NADP-dependent oxidoreductase